MDKLQEKLQSLYLELENSRSPQHADKIRDQIDDLELAMQKGKVKEEVKRERRPPLGSSVAGVSLRK